MLTEFSVTSNMLSSILEPGRCEFFFENYTREARERRVYLNEKMQVTIMVAEPQYYQKQYTEYHGDGLTECDDSQWPLALTKQTEWNTVTVE